MKPLITQRPDDSWLDKTFFEGQARIGPQALHPYAGRYVAWSWDGGRILDSAEDEVRLVDQLVAAGVDVHRVVFDYVDIF